MDWEIVITIALGILAGELVYAILKRAFGWLLLRYRLRKHIIKIRMNSRFDDLLITGEKLKDAFMWVANAMLHWGDRMRRARVKEYLDNMEERNWGE